MAPRIDSDPDRIESEPNRIDRHTQTSGRRSLAREISAETDVAVPLDLLAPESLISLISVVRRPPELQLQFGTSEQPGGLSSSDEAELNDLGQMTTPDLGYQLASFLVRREDEIAQSNEPFVQAGFAELELSARMLEHLMIKRTSGTP